MKAAILTIGDELLLGQTVNSNAAWLGEQLDLLGIRVVRTLTVEDEQAAIHEALGWAFEGTDLVITTGGLGPTDDDLTREAVASFWGRDLLFQEEVFARIKARFAERGRTVPESNRTQALVPEGFTWLPNPNGTAPGLWYAEDERLMAALPGVPREMKYLYANEVQPRLRQHLDGQIIRHRFLCTAGIGESSLHEKVGDVSDLLSDTLRLAYLPSPQGVRLRLTARGDEEQAVDEQLDRLEARLRSRIDRYIFGTGADTLEEIVGARLRKRGLTIAVAESCTGGYVANQITDVPGASDYLRGSVVAYSNASKRALLNVEEAALREEGAVSEQVACQMADGARHALGADIGISTTGIAGPTGGTPDKPVGTVWIGYADAEGAEAKLLELVKDRTLNKALTCTALLNWVRKQLERTPVHATPA